MLMKCQADTVHRENTQQDGQSIVIIAILMVILLGFIALAIDGGNVFAKRRTSQNAADASALSATHYIATASMPNETRLIARIHELVELNGIPDTDEFSGNEINDNVSIIYTDPNGNPISGCNEVPCGIVPAAARGITTIVRYQFPTMIAGVIGISEATVSSSATAIIRGGDASGSAGTPLLTLSDRDSCDLVNDKPMAISGQYNEVIGKSHTNSHVHVSGQNNHFHGQVTVVGNWNNNDYNPANNILFEPESPGWPLVGSGALANPYGGLSVSDFAPNGLAVAGVPSEEYFNLTAIADDPVILENLPQLNGDELRSGVYYAGDKEIHLGKSDIHGTITLVGSRIIDISGTNQNFTAYLPNGILMFSDMQPTDPCRDPSILLSGGSRNLEPVVSHQDGCPFAPSNIENSCWSPSNHVFNGIIYAPRGSVNIASSRTTFIGGLVGWGITVDGSKNLFVTNSATYSLSEPVIELIQ